MAAATRVKLRRRRPRLQTRLRERECAHAPFVDLRERLLDRRRLALVAAFSHSAAATSRPLRATHDERRLVALLIEFSNHLSSRRLFIRLSRASRIAACRYVAR